jgi:GDP/UDP-N,N'-diacetylbacillosamine 2-epimerase (hydrolysing)
MRRICVITGSRADYGLLKPLMTKFKYHSSTKLITIVTGMHLSNAYGNTHELITQDGFEINWKVEMLLGSNSPASVSKSVGLGTIGFTDAFESLVPDLVILLGDRFEVFAAATAATILGIPIAHLHGGEVTIGAYDDYLRHAMTKMASYHFTSNEIYRRRVIQMGAFPEVVWNVGGFGLDGIFNSKKMDKLEFEQKINFKLGERNLLVSFHPETATNADTAQQIDELLDALDQSRCHLIFTLPNADQESSKIKEAIINFVQMNQNKSCFYTSLGQEKYYGAIQNVDAVIGNSSSGLIEVPVFKKPTINIGQRQDGRLRASSVIDVPNICSANILTAIHSVFVENYQKILKTVDNPYGEPGAAEKTFRIVMELDFLKIPKGFNDLIGNFEV